MTKSSDIRVEAVTLTFTDERLATPLQLSTGLITDVTYASVVLAVRTRSGHEHEGRGATFLSDLWAFPNPAYTHVEKDGAMRRLCEALAAALSRANDYGDPMELGHALELALSRLIAEVEAEDPALQSGAIPYLAALNCLAPFDAALHDAWGRALGGSAYQFYDEPWLNADLGAYLGAAFRGHYPARYLQERRQQLLVQHVVGAGDALLPDATTAVHPTAEQATAKHLTTGLPQDLQSWIKRDGVSCFKIKTRGQDPLVDAQRVHEVHKTALGAGLPPAAIHLSFDPNEACPDPAFLTTMLDYLAAEAPAALQAIDYIEQPTGRDLASYTFTLHEVSARKPVLIDESLDRLENLERLQPLGWSGLALKSCKGQTHSLLAYCWGRARGLFMTVQDLTNPGLALVHNANLCAHLALGVAYFEANGRQYAPAACAQEQAAYPHFFHVCNGALTLPTEPPIGLY